MAPHLWWRPSQRRRRGVESLSSSGGSLRQLISLCWQTGMKWGSVGAGPPPSYHQCSNVLTSTVHCVHSIKINSIARESLAAAGNSPRKGFCCSAKAPPEPVSAQCVVLCVRVCVTHPGECAKGFTLIHIHPES